MNQSNLVQIFSQTARTRPDQPSLRYKEKGQWVTLNWHEVEKQVYDLVGGLKKLGVKKGERVCILAKTCYQWTVADLAILASGGVTVPIYESSLAAQAAYIINNSEAKVIFVEDAVQYEKVRSLHHQLGTLKQIIIIKYEQEKREEGVYSLDEVLLLGSGLGETVFAEQARELTLDDEASYVYTSGTTGPPKGAVLTHGNFIGEMKALEQVLDFPHHMESLIFLPLAHILARVVQFAQIYKGFVQCYAESIDKLMDNIAETRPHLIASVPRIFEKVHTRVMQGVEASSPAKQGIFQWALKVGQGRSECQLRRKSLPLGLRFQWMLAHKLVFSKLHQRLGGRIDYFISGGAPLSKEIGDFFHAAGFLILEGYGLTETTGALCVNSKQRVKMGTVGVPIPDVKIRIAEDGEILAKGPIIFQGYFKSPEATREAIDAEGWFHTGDIGIIDNEGFVTITDRKKDIIVTAAGKNIAPQNIENLIKSDPFISQIMVHGDKRKYLSALVTLDQDEIMNYARSHKIPFQGYQDLVKSEQIHALIKQRIDQKNKQLATYETVKKFAILDKDFSVESGELTPTMKVKRRFTSDKYKEILDSLYQERE